MRGSVVFGVTLKLLVINISSSFPAINTAACYQRCVTTCGAVAVVHRRQCWQRLPVVACYVVSANTLNCFKSRLDITEILFSDFCVEIQKTWSRGEVTVENCQLKSRLIVMWLCVRQPVIIRCHLYCVCCCSYVVMLRRINSNSSHGNDYVLADTDNRNDTAVGLTEQFYLGRPL